MDEFVRGIAGSCPNALAPLGGRPLRKWNQDVFGMFVAEIRSDLVLNAVRQEAEPAGALESAVKQVQWKKASLKELSDGAVSDWKGQVSVQPSDVCADARELVDSNATKVPSGGRRLIDDLVALDNVDIDTWLDSDAADCSFAGDALICLVDRDARPEATALGKVYEQYTAAVEKLFHRDIEVARSLGVEKAWRAYEQLEEDADAKSNARNMVSEVESCFTDTEDYRRCNSARELGRTGLPYGSGGGKVMVARATRDTYRIAAHSKSGNRFTITKRRNGTIGRSCTKRGRAACPRSGRW